MKNAFFNRVRERLAFRSWYTDQQNDAITSKLERIEQITHFYFGKANASATIAKDQYLSELLRGERYRDPLRLEPHGFKVYSQSDEDGIIAEIFRRIGTPNKTFIEFGVEAGLESNSLYLLLQDWRGLWIEGNEKHVAAIESTFANVLAAGRLSVRQAFITAENINDLIAPFASGEVDLLSIDIDANDYYVWEALNVVSPRAVVIEFNAKFRPPVSIAPSYVPDRVWSHRDDYSGCSLEALVRLGRRKGYSLVGCNLVGVNAFFVRNDLVDGKFQRKRCPGGTF